jgi:IrrE N-terminal-like domain
MLPRGFKADTERRAITLRAEMGLGPADALPPADLAEHLGVGFRMADTLVPMAALAALDKLQPGCFSACTLPGPTGPVIVVNPLNSAGRQQSDAMHELSHILLRHETRQLERIGDLVFFTCDPDQEEQADHLGATLLLPRPLLVAAHAGGLTIAAIAETYGVSEQLARWRVNSTGVSVQVKRRKAAPGTAPAR